MSNKAHTPDYKPSFTEAGLSLQELKIEAPALRRTHHTWGFQDTDNEACTRFRERFQLDKIIEGADDEWHALQLLRNWVYLQNVRGGGDGPNNIPGSEMTGTRGGHHNSVTRVIMKPTHMIGGYAQQSWGFNYYGTVGCNRDEMVVVRKMDKVDWLEGSDSDDLPQPLPQTV